MADIAHLKFDLSPTSIGTVTLNGVDISGHTSCIEIRAAAGELSEIKLCMLARIEGDLSALLDQCKVNQPRRPRLVTVTRGYVLKFKSDWGRFWNWVHR